MLKSVSMKLSSLLDSELIVKKDFKDPLEMLDTLLKAVCRKKPLPVPAGEVREAVLERKKHGGSVFGTGLALPHLRFENLDDFIIAVAIQQDAGKPVLSPDGPETGIKMMALVLASNGNPALFLNTLSAFGKISGDTEFFNKLLAATPRSFPALIKERDIDLTRTITIGSIMNRNVISLKPEDTVADAADIFVKYRFHYIPVIDSEGRFAGEVTLLDLISLCLPDYALRMTGLRFLKNFEPLEEFLKKEHTLRLKEIMKKPLFVLDEDAPVIQAILSFVQSGSLNLPVMKDGKLTGMAGYMDILNKVLKV